MDQRAGSEATIAFLYNKELENEASRLCGYILKKSPSVFKSWQKRYFKMLDSGKLLAYYDKEPVRKSGDAPKGTLKLLEVERIEEGSDLKFTLHYPGREFELKAQNSQDYNKWLKCLNYMSKITKATAEMEEKKRNKSLFTESSSGSRTESMMSDVNGKSGKSPAGKKGGWKMNNLDHNVLEALKSETPDLVIPTTSNAKKLQELSEIALDKKGIKTYLKNEKPEILDPRIIYGFLFKRNKGAIKRMLERWCIMVSSRPLTEAKYVSDDIIMKNNCLPAWMEFDTIYYFEMSNETDDSTHLGEIPMKSIINIEVKDMTKSKDKGHTFIIDAGENKIHFNTEFKSGMDKWLEAINLARKTEVETKMSITGASKNISKILALYDENKDELKANIKNEFHDIIPQKDNWEDIEELIDLCEIVKNDLITTFDACLANRPQREDVLHLYMETKHKMLIDVLSKTWLQQALELNSLQTLALLEWTHNYIKELKKFGISDDSMDNGYLVLCNAFSKKTQKNVTPMLVEILKNERAKMPEADESDHLYTTSPLDLFKIFYDTIERIKVKGLKELLLQVLVLVKELLSEYQKALHQLVLNKNIVLSKELLIALMNNSIKFFDEANKLIDSVLEEGCTREEVDKHFNLRDLNKVYQKITDSANLRLVDETFKSLQPYFRVNYLDLKLDNMLKQSLESFENVGDKLQQIPSRIVWMGFLERTLACYIQCMLNSSTKIKQASSQAVLDKMKKDKDIIKDTFEQFLKPKPLEAGLEILEDLVSFLDSDVEFIGADCAKMRTVHGPAFKLQTVKALLNLKPNLNKEERVEAFNICKSTLDSFQNSDKRSQQTKNIFSHVDAPSANGGVRKEEEDEVDLADFLREGGIDLDDIEEEAAMEDKKEELKEEVQEEKDVTMEGWLDKKTSNGEDETMFNSLTRKWQRRYFAVKNETLYWYKKDTAREASNSLPLKSVADIYPKKDLKFVILFEKKEYKLKAESTAVRDKWLRVIKRNIEAKKDLIVADRYLNIKIFEKVTGKSIFKDYDVILEEYNKKIRAEQERIEKEQREERERQRREARLEAAKNGTKFEEVERKNELKKSESLFDNAFADDIAKIETQNSFKPGKSAALTNTSGMHEFSGIEDPDEENQNPQNFKEKMKKLFGGCMAKTKSMTQGCLLGTKNMINKLKSKLKKKQPENQADTYYEINGSNQ